MYDSRVPRSSPSPLILIHIPKTAGTTLSQMLRVHFGAWPPTRWLRHARTLGYYHLGYARPEHMEARLSRIAALSPRQRRQVCFFAAHAGYGLHERMPSDLRATAGYLTVLREPVSRVISTFKHLQAEGRIAPDLNLRNYIDHRRHYGLFKFDNAQTRYLAAEQGRTVDAHPHHVTREMLEVACERLERDLWWFGLTERFDESVLLLADLLGWRKPRYVSARVAAAATIDPPETSLLARIAEINALDMELYAFARTLLERRIVAAGPEFAARVEIFRARNARYARRMSPIAGALPNARRTMQKLGLLRG